MPLKTKSAHGIADVQVNILVVFEYQGHGISFKVTAAKKHVAGLKTV